MNKTVRSCIIAATAFFVLLTLLRSWSVTTKSGGTDLRCRVVAARLAFTHHSPYFYKWQQTDGEYLLDPNDDPKRIVNGNVVTPATLFLIAPLSQALYPKVRIIWTFVQYLLLAGLLFALIKSRAPHHAPAWIPTIVVTVGLVCSDFWLLHVERGQVYILYAFLFGGMYCLYTLNKKYSHFFSGFIGGVFILIRPLTLVLGLPFLLAKNWKWVTGCLVGFVVGCLLFIAPKPALWTDYLKAMQQYTREEIGPVDTLTPTLNTVRPAVIEGAQNMGVIYNFSTDSLKTFHHYCSLIGIDTSDLVSLTVYGLLLMLLSVFFYRSKAILSTEKIFLFAFLLYLLFELFIVAPRGAYNLVQWIFPVYLIVRHYWQNKTILTILITGLLLLHGFPFSFYWFFPMGELVLLLLLAYLIFQQRDCTANHG